MRTKRIVSIILSIMIVCSSFAGLTVFADDTTTHTYTAVGDADFLGEKWSPDYYENDLTLQSDGTYKITYTNVAKSDCYIVKVAEDHSWENYFGPALGDDSNIEFSVPEDDSTVDIILTLQGTKEKDIEGVLTTFNDGYVTILVNGAVAPDKIIPDITEYYVAGMPGLCNGITWNPAAPENKMIDMGDGSYEITFTGVQPTNVDVMGEEYFDEEGNPILQPYEFKVIQNGKWGQPTYGYDGKIPDGGANAQLMITEADSTVKIVLTEDLYVEAYVNGVNVTPIPEETTTIPTFTTNEKGETSGIIYGGGFFYPPYDVECNRYFFQMPVDVLDNNGDNHNWRTFTNATATCFWWDGEYACESWQNSYQMHSAGLENIYYIDVPTDVGTILFTNGIDGGYYPEEDEEPNPNWGKNCQTVNVGAEYYEPNENPNYPKGTKTFNNMIYIVDVNNMEFSEYSGAVTYGGEWRYLHSDGSIDYTPGTIYEPKGIIVTTDKTAVTLKNGASTTVKATVRGGDLGYTTEWASSNEKVAVVDQNGKITAKGKGTADVTVKVQNPGSETDIFVATVKVTVSDSTGETVSVTTDRTEVTLMEGDSTTIDATVEGADFDYELEWESDDFDVADVSQYGEIYAYSAGTATITVRVLNTEDYTYVASAQVKVTVGDPTEKTVRVTTDRTEVSLTAGDSTTIDATVEGADFDYELEWESDDFDVAGVDRYGEIYAYSAGTATITVRVLNLEDYTYVASAQVKVNVDNSTGGRTGNCRWSYDEETQTLTISGNGKMGNYYENWELPWYSYSGSAKNVVIENGVTNIGNYAFTEFKKLTSVTIPDSVTSIGYDSFSYCKSLTSFTIPKSVTSIEDSSFDSCTSLAKIEVDKNNKNYSSKNGVLYNKSQTELLLYAAGKTDSTFTVPNSVTGIADNAFTNCTSLTDITIPNSVTYIGYGAFRNCSGLTKITIPDSVEYMGSNLFRECTNLTSVIILADISSINYSFFADCSSLKSISIPESVTSIDDYAFENCTSLKSVTIPNGVTYIGECAFENCTSLKSVTIPDGVTYIGSEAFGNCTGLTAVTIPDSISYIAGWTFEYCEKLTEVKIPNSVEGIGSRAFYGCTSLNHITIPDSVESIGSKAFSDTEYFNRQPNGVVYVGDWAVGYKGEMPINTNIKIKDGTKGMCHSIFSDGLNLKEIVIPDSVKIIGDYAFEECENLTSVTLSKNITRLGYDTFLGCTSLKSITIPDSVVSIGEYAFSNCTSLTGVTMPDSVTEIGEYAFSNCTSLTEATIPNGVSRIDYSTFKNCTSLKSVTIPDSVRYIEENSFEDCTSLTEVIIPESVTYIGDSAFLGCKKITSVTIPDTVTDIGWKAFGYYYEYHDFDDDYFDEDYYSYYKIDGFTIYGYKDSSAMDYADEYDFDFVSLGKRKDQSVSVDETNYELENNAKPFNLNAKARTAISYKSSDTSVAEVSSNGTVTIKGVGSATITVIAKGTETYKPEREYVYIYVYKPKSDQKVTGFKANNNVTLGGKPFSLNAKAETKLSYVSDNKSVAEVSADGIVTIKGVGTATITITAEETADYNSATATVKITVAKATQRVTGVKSQYVTSAGKSFSLNAKAKTKLTYTSSNKNVAVVSSTGKVTVKAGGCAYITVKASENGNYKSATVKTKIISAPKDFTSKDVSKVKKTGKTKAKITWKSLTGATGYTVQLATNKSYKGAKTVKNSKNTATLTGLKKGKTYYVRINAYAKVSGKNYSNKWYTVKFKMK
ncbi:MAG: leucine-rich repeat protein [Oscillospiraceae bacterium]|nr:leucine-rich repeat protein [Oscillospiraceae bacterium]